MKRIATLVGVAMMAMLVACSSTSQVSPGAIDGSAKSCPAACAGKSSGDCGQCPHAAKSDEAVSPGAVSDSKCTKSASCCGAKKASGN